MPQFQSSAWWNAWQGDDTPRNRDAGGCNNNDHEISRHRKGRKGRRRHWCVSANGHCASEQGGDCRGGDHIRYNASRQGHNPCKSANAIKYIGVHQGGVESGQKATDFQNSDIGLKCDFHAINDGILRGWHGGTNNHLKNHAGVKGHRGDGQGQHKFRSVWEQALFGIKTSAGTENAGYCLNTAHLMKDVGGGTCYQKIKDEITATKAEAEARKWCETNRSSPKCKCINVVEAGGTNFINHCKGKDGWAGCDEIVEAYKKFEDAGLTSASGLFGNADCLVPGICDGDKIVPTSGKPGSCANKLAICDQKVATDNIKAQNLLIEQGCEINFEADADAADGQTPPPPPPPPSSDRTSSTPVTSSSSNDDDDDDDGDDGEEKSFYEKSTFQFGGATASSISSSFSSACLILLAFASG